MNKLTLLVTLQTILIAVILWKVLIAPQPPALPESTSPSAVPAQPVSTPAFTEQQTTPASVLDEGQLRRIIREELASQINSLDQSNAPAEPENKPPPVSAAEYQSRLELANQQLEYHIRQGEISSVDMAELEINIARLDPESRQRMLNLLSQAVNAGELKPPF